MIAWADLAAPCTVLAGMTILPCAVPTGLWTGLACDSGKRRLYATDGLRLVTVPCQLAGALPVLQPPACCPPVAPGPDPLIGLAVRPGVATSNGASCNNGSCPACPTTLRLHIDSVLGNDRHGFELGQAAAGSLAWTVLGFGPCAPPGAVVPPLCGPVYTPAVLGTLGPAVVGGGGVCNGTASFPLPLPANAAFAGMVLGAQSIVVCPGPAGFGSAVSNCLSFELQGKAWPTSAFWSAPDRRWRTEACSAAVPQYACTVTAIGLVARKQVPSCVRPWMTNPAPAIQVGIVKAMVPSGP